MVKFLWVISILVIFSVNRIEARVNVEDSLSYALSFVESRVKLNNEIINLIENESIPLSDRYSELVFISGFKFKSTKKIQKNYQEIFLNQLKEGLRVTNQRYERVMKVVDFDFTEAYFGKLYSNFKTFLGVSHFYSSVTIDPFSSQHKIRRLYYWSCPY